MTNGPELLDEQDALQEIEDLTTIFVTVNEVLADRLTPAEIDRALGLKDLPCPRRRA